MNKAIAITSRTSPPQPGSARLASIITQIGEGELARDLTRELAYAPLEIVRENRLGALRLPISAGGSGASFRQLIKTVVDLAAADANVAHILRNHYCFVELFAQPNIARSEKWTKLVEEGHIFGLAAGELGKTAGAGLVDTTVERVGSSIRLNGTKFYSTGSLYSDYILVRAAWTDGRKASVVVPAKREGVEIEDDWDGMGQRLTGSGTTRFFNVAINEDEIYSDAPEDGFRPAYSTTLGHLLVTSVVAGVIRAAANDAAALIKRRNRSFAHAPTPNPSEDPILQQTLGQIASAAFAAEATVLAAADALDAVNDGEYTFEKAQYAALTAAQAKVTIDEIGTRAASMIFDVGGASAATRKANLDRHWRNIRTLISHNPASYKAIAIGALELNGTALPDNGFF